MWNLSTESACHQNKSEKIKKNLKVITRQNEKQNLYEMTNAEQISY
jgi:hypothetical protein